MLKRCNGKFFNCSLRSENRIKCVKNSFMLYIQRAQKIERTLILEYNSNWTHQWQWNTANWILLKKMATPTLRMSKRYTEEDHLSELSLRRIYIKNYQSIPWRQMHHMKHKCNLIVGQEYYARSKRKEMNGLCSEQYGTLMDGQKVSYL